MTWDRIVLFALFALFAAVFGLPRWRRFRHGLVAFAALMAAVVPGEPPEALMIAASSPAILISRPL